MATYSHNLDAGILGLGYGSVVLDELKGQGVVETKDFSISLGDSASAQGMISSSKLFAIPLNRRC